MLLKERIAALVMTVVMTFTTVNFLPDNIMPEDTNAVIASDTDAAEEQDTEEVNSESITVYDLSPGNVIVDTSGKWDTSISVTGQEPTYGFENYAPIDTGKHSYLIVTDSQGNTTVGYCMQPGYSAPDADSYSEGRNSRVTDEMVAGCSVMSKFLYGGTLADPNADLYSETRNINDGGTYGTYLIPDDNGEIKPVRGLMIGGHVYELTVSEARTLSSLAVHATTGGSNITSVTSATNPNVAAAYNHLMNISNAGKQWYVGGRTMHEVAEWADEQEWYNAHQRFTWTIYNTETGTWDNYTSTDNIASEYISADKKINIQVSYYSDGMANNLTTNVDDGLKKVNHNFSQFTIGSTTAYFDYFKILTNDDNTVPFTVTFDEILAGQELYQDGFAFSTTYSKNTFEQTATIEVNADELANGKLSISATTEDGMSATPAYNAGTGNFSCRMYKNDDAQDCFVVNSNVSVIHNSSITADVNAIGVIEIHKYSTDPDITNNNKCYSLKGAEFSIFKTRADANNEKNAVAVIVTDEHGSGSTDVPYGTYYVKETKPAPGFKKNSTIYRANVNNDIPVTFNVPETPEHDPAEVLVRKKNSEKEIFLEGAVFEIKYYDVQMDTDPAKSGYQAIRTWYLKTDKDGYASLLSTEYILPESDEFFYDKSTGFPTIPIGTITVQEIEAPEGYILDDTIHTFRITDNPEGIPHVEIENERTIPNAPIKQSFQLTKYGEGKDKDNPLANAGFSACNVDDLTEVNAAYQPKENEVIVTSDDGKHYIWDSSKLVILTDDGKTEMFTDENGYACSCELEYGKYIVRETTVPKNYLPIKEFTVNITASGAPQTMLYFTDMSFKAYLKIIKKDDETKKAILNNNATFKIWSYDDKEYLAFKTTDEAGKDITVTELKTNEAGELLTPEPLMPGKYRIDETENPEAYYTSDTNKTYDITIADDQVYSVYEDEQGKVTDMGIFTIEVENTAFKGQINIHKTGEDRTYNEELGEFENKDIDLKDIQFGIYAEEDIYTADGQEELLYKKGALVETVTTDAEGNATSKNLPLGKYRIHEENVPEGYLQMDDEIIILSLDGEIVKTTDENGKEHQVIYSILEIKNKLIIPKIRTTAKDSVSLNNTASPSEKTTLIDTITYSDFVAGKKYRIETVVMDKQLKTKLLVNDKEVRGTTTITFEKSSGTVDVSVSLDSSGLAGKDIVFFEYIYDMDGKLIALHADINDGGQTITFPPDTPPTGDTFPIATFIIFAVVSFMGIILLILKRKNIILKR